MQNVKISALPNSTTAPADTDVFPTVESMGGVPVTKRKAWSVLKSTLLTWLNAAVYPSSQYTPTLYDSTNVAASTPEVCNYARLGANMVLVTGWFYCDPTTTGITTILGMSIPIASNFTVANSDAGGVANQYNVMSGTGIVVADTANDRVTFYLVPNSAANTIWYFSFMYIIK